MPDAELRDVFTTVTREQQQVVMSLLARVCAIEEVLMDANLTNYDWLNDAHTRHLSILDQRLASEKAKQSEEVEDE